MESKIKTRTAEERQAEAEALHATIVEQVQQLTDSGKWQAFLEFARSFHKYSLNNLLLILSQNPDATMVAGFRQWQAKGRQVRKGEKSIKIFGYREKATRLDGTDETPKATSACFAVTPLCPYSTLPKQTRSKRPSRYQRTRHVDCAATTTTASSFL